jgi:hypothetical protein
MRRTSPRKRSKVIMVRRQPKRRTSFILKGVLFGLLGVVMMGVCLPAGSAGSGGSRGPSPSLAKLMAEDFIGQKLLAPSSAEYSHAEAFREESGFWVVRGHVDAQNALGVPVRHRYTVRMEVNGDHWTPLLCNVVPQ